MCKYENKISEKLKTNKKKYIVPTFWKEVQ